MRNKLIAVLMAVCVALSFSVFSGCNKNKIDPNKTQKLEILLYNAGYGYEWCEKILAAFKEEDWVKEKYPELETSFEKTEVVSRPTELMTASKKVNHYDLLMGSGLYAYINPADGYVADLTEGVYNSQVPGEDILFKDKLMPSYRKSAAYFDSSEKPSNNYYLVNYASGMRGLIYNSTVLEALGKDVPNTTDELVDIMKYVKELNGTNSMYKETYSYVCASTTTYNDYLLNLWWAQYEGSDEYANFYMGIDSELDRRSPTVFEQKGRLRSLEVLESFLYKDTGYTWLNPRTGTEAFREAQNKLYTGEAIFTSVGDWVDNETKDFREGLEGLGMRCDKIMMMKTPIISSIIEVLPDKSIKTDAVLSAVIDAVDDGVKDIKDLGIEYIKTGVTEEDLAAVTQKDLTKIYKARSIIIAGGVGHDAVIPEYASGKEVAMDFLRYLATDKANEIYIRTLDGASLPFLYDVRQKNPALYNECSPFQQERLNYFYNFEIDTLPEAKYFPLARLGGLSSFYTSNPSNSFLSGEKFDESKYSSLAEEIYTVEYEYWENDPSAWSSCLALAGLR